MGCKPPLPLSTSLNMLACFMALVNQGTKSRDTFDFVCEGAWLLFIARRVFFIQGLKIIKIVRWAKTEFGTCKEIQKDLNIYVISAECDLFTRKFRSSKSEVVRKKLISYRLGLYYLFRASSNNEIKSMTLLMSGHFNSE